MRKTLLLAFIIGAIGCTKRDVAPVAPAPTATFSVSGGAYGKYDFNVSATNADTYAWNFGDGEKSTVVSPSHSYAQNGTFSVTLTATGKGGSTTATRSLSVNDVRGTGTFWMKTGDYYVDVTVDDKYLLTITSNYSSAPSCGANGTASFTFLTQGVHNFTAKEKGRTFPKSWSGTIGVVAGQCSTMQLIY